MTIHPATFNSSSKESINLVRNMMMLGNYNNDIFYPNNMPSELRPLPYEKAWEKCTISNWFNIQLEDGSLLIYKKDSYIYMMPPIKTLSYEEYLESYYPQDEWGDADEFKVMISQEYDNYIDTHTKNFPPLPVRYDIDEEHYCEHSHPYCHFHFGIENEGRVATQKILTPLSFTAFILRSFYPKQWKKYSESDLITEHLRHFKGNLGVSPPNYWKGYEKDLLYIG